MNLPAPLSLNPNPTERRSRLVPRRLAPTDAPGEIMPSWFLRRIKPSRVLPTAYLMSTCREKSRGKVPWRRD